MAGPFKLRSQGSTFKEMGATPMYKRGSAKVDKSGNVDIPVINAALNRPTTTPSTTNSEGKANVKTSSKKSGTDYATMQRNGSDRYKNLSAADYKAEVQRQVKSKSEGKGYNAHKYNSKGELAEDFDPNVNKYNKTKTDKTAETPPATQPVDSKDVTSDNVKVSKTRKQKRAARRVKNLQEKATTKGSLNKRQVKKLARNESKAKGEKVKFEDRSKYGQSIRDEAREKEKENKE